MFARNLTKLGRWQGGSQAGDEWRPGQSLEQSNAGGKSTNVPNERGRQVRVRKAPGREMVLVKLTEMAEEQSLAAR